MKLGFVSAILDQSNYEEMMDIASKLGFECVEVACWPQGKAERRYAGVSHIDAERVLVDEEYAKHVIDYAKSKNVENIFSSLLSKYIGCRFKQKRSCS